jgi:hypothetical protein
MSKILVIVEDIELRVSCVIVSHNDSFSRTFTENVFKNLSGHQREVTVFVNTLKNEIAVL